MDYLIEQKPAFTVVGKALRVTTKDGENLRVIPQFWQQCLSDGTYAKLAQLSTSAELLRNSTLGICADFEADMGAFTYIIAAEKIDGGIPEGMAERTIPEASWAVFEAKGPMPDAIQDVWSKIWSEFFVSEPYVHGAAPDIELYPAGDASRADYLSQVWVPVVSK